MSVQAAAGAVIPHRCPRICLWSCLSAAPAERPDDLEGTYVKVIAIEEHSNGAGIPDALDRMPSGERDESVAFNAMGDNQARLEDIGPGRIEAMDATGIDVSILSLVTPAT